MQKAAAQDVSVSAESLHLEGFLTVPENARGVVLFAHGSGSSRFSARNRQVAENLNKDRFATLLFDLLSAEENERDMLTREYRFDIPLLAGRLTAAVEWVRGQRQTAALPVGLFGASTGAAAALIAAAALPGLVSAVVSRGGRPDLAGEALGKVKAPVLLIVGGNDTQVIDLNRDAAAQLNCENRIVIVPGASHLFEEAGALEEVERLATEWFAEKLHS